MESTARLFQYGQIAADGEDGWRDEPSTQKFTECRVAVQRRSSHGATYGSV